MWKFIQGSIVFAVVGSNIQWKWTPNHYLPAILGFVLAVVVTGATNELRDWLASRTARKKQINQSTVAYRGPRPPPLP